MPSLAGVHKSVYTVGDFVKMGASGLPFGTLYCDGSAVSRTTYALLFAKIGTAYGAGDTTTTFNLPDGRGRAIIGDGTGAGLTARTRGSYIGEENHALSTSELAAHAHGVTDPGHNHGISDPGHQHGGYMQNAVPPFGTEGVSSTDVMVPVTSGLIVTSIPLVRSHGTGVSVNNSGVAVSVNSAGSGANHNNMQPVTVGKIAIAYI